MKISVIILCFNESKNLKYLISQSKKLIKVKNIEIIFVDNGSTDNSKKILKKIPKSKYIKVKFVKKNIGYGYGILSGLNVAKGDIIGWTHGDDLDFFDKMKTILKTKFHYKYFFLKGYRIGKRPLIDTFFSYGFNIVSSFFLQKKLWEITAHPTFFSKNLFYKYKKYLPYDFSIDLYLFYFAKKDHYNVKRIKFDYNERKLGVSSRNKNFFSKIKLMINYISKILRLVYLNIFII